MKNKWIAYSLILLLVIFAGFYLYSILRTKPNRPVHTEEFVQQEPEFRHDGDLIVHKAGNPGDTLATMEIEIVDDAYGITTGLMYRKKMEANRGMLFLFPNVEMRSFWMKNTYIPLDIVFIAEDHSIVNIQKNTTPFSEASIPSSGPAKYVLEVNAGTADKLGWQAGDVIRWTTK